SGQMAEIESIVGLASRPTRDWADRDPDQAALTLAEFALKFRRAEALARVKGRKPTREAMAVVIGTGGEGKAVFEEFRGADRDRPRVAALTDEIQKLLARFGADRNVALAALAATGVNTLADTKPEMRKVG